MHMATDESISSEEWRPITWLNTRARTYEVSSLGRVRRVLPSPRIMSTYHNRQGYLVVPITTVPKKGIRVHQLVARAFIGERPTGLVVNHIDHNKTNNRADNLEYITAGLNVSLAYRAGRHDPSILLKGKVLASLTPEAIAKRSGEKAGKAKLTEVQALQIRDSFGLVSAAVLAKRYNVTRQTIKDIGYGNSWTCLPIIRADGHPGAIRRAGRGVFSILPAKCIQCGCFCDGKRRRIDLCRKCRRSAADLLDMATHSAAAP